MRKNTKLKAALAANLLTAALVAAGWIWMALTKPEPGTLEGDGITNLRFYTVLSNLLAGLVALVYAAALLRVLRGKAENVAPWVQTLALAAAASIALTFLTVACFLAPAYPELNMFRGANLLFHLLIPLLCMASYVLLAGFGRPRRFAVLLCAVPMLLYGVCYTANCLINGIGEWPQTNDWYGFLNWGLPVGFVIFAALALTTIGTAALLQLGNRKLAARTKASQTE